MFSSTYLWTSVPGLEIFFLFARIRSKNKYLLKGRDTPRIVNLIWLTCYNQTSGRIWLNSHLDPPKSKSSFKSTGTGSHFIETKAKYIDKRNIFSNHKYMKIQSGFKGPKTFHVFESMQLKFCWEGTKAPMNRYLILNPLHSLKRSLERKWESKISWDIIQPSLTDLWN